jgi:hypothetical protein
VILVFRPNARDGPESVPRLILAGFYGSRWNDRALGGSVLSEDGRVFSRFKIKRQRRRITRQDREYLEARVRRFLNGYLSAGDVDKDRYLEVVAGAAAACQPANVISDSENLQVAEIAAATANAVVMRRIGVGKDPDDRAYTFMTDACATVAVAYRRAAAIYVGDEQMQTLGTAAVHLLTMATSRRMAKLKSEQESSEASASPDFVQQSSEQSCNG